MLWEKLKQSKRDKKCSELGYYLLRVLDLGKSNKLTFEQKHKRKQGANQADIGMMSVLDKRNNSGKGPEIARRSGGSGAKSQEMATKSLWKVISPRVCRTLKDFSFLLSFLFFSLFSLLPFLSSSLPPFPSFIFVL